MGGIGGRPSWAWIFILEGLATILVAFLAKFLIHDSPETSVSHTFFILPLLILFFHTAQVFQNAVERTEVKERLTQDHSSLANEHHSRYTRSALKEWKIYVHMFIAICE